LSFIKTGEELISKIDARPLNKDECTQCCGGSMLLGIFFQASVSQDKYLFSSWKSTGGLPRWFCKQMW